jgi:hypothetical protein
MKKGSFTTMSPGDSVWWHADLVINIIVDLLNKSVCSGNGCEAKWLETTPAEGVSYYFHPNRSRNLSKLNLVKCNTFS